MDVRVFKPNKRLQEWVATYLYVDANPEEAAKAFGFAPPTNTEGMQIHLGAPTYSSITDFEEPMPRYLITGRYTKPIEIEFKGPFKVILVFFHKAYSADFFQISMEPYINQDIDLSELYPDITPQFDEKLRSAPTIASKIKVLDNLLLRLQSNREHNYSLVRHAVKNIYSSSGNITVKGLAEEFDTSQKTLETKFKNKVGLPPKKYIDIVRINFVLDKLKQFQSYKLNGLIGKTGFYDESHLIKNCNKLLELTPKAFFEEHDQKEWFQFSPIKKQILSGH
jgi:AraC-like DNA-binding protein